MGTGTTLLAAAHCERNGIGVEIDESYVREAKTPLEAEPPELFPSMRPYVVKARAAR